jgi:hypothetical protein
MILSMSRRAADEFFCLAGTSGYRQKPDIEDSDPLLALWHHGQQSLSGRAQAASRLSGINFCAG